MGFKLKVI